MKTATRQPRSKRREEIALTALRIIGEQGIAALSTAALAAEVGVTTGALFRHFSSKDEILAEATACACRAIEETFPDEDDEPLSRVLTLAEQRISLMAAQPGIAWALQSDQARLALSDEARASLEAMKKRTKAFLRRALVEAIGAGQVRSDVAPDLLLVTVIGTVHTLIGMRARAHGGRRAAVSTRRGLEGLRRLLLPPSLLVGECDAGANSL